MARARTASPAPKTPTTTLTVVTPAMAEEWLTRNTHNRPVRDAKVNSLADAIKRGEWKVNGDAIRFDINGVLLDGQHRLWAVVMSECSIQTNVTRNLEPGSQITMDIGERRRLSDHLKLMGYPSTNMLAAVINMKWKLDNGLARTNATPTVQQALHLLEEHPYLTEAVGQAARWRSRLYGGAAPIGALWYEMSSRDPDAAEAFFSGIIEGVGLEKGSPMLAMRRHVENTKPSTVVLMALLIKAWNAYLDGKEVNSLSWRPVGTHAEMFPELKGG